MVHMWCGLFVPVVRPSASILHTVSDKNWTVGRPGNEAIVSPRHVWITFPLYMYLVWLCLMRLISTAPLDNVIMSSEKQPIRLRQPLTSCGEMHLLPCSVQMERVGGGPARVDSYFTPLVRKENEVTAGDMKGTHSNL